MQFKLFIVTCVLHYSAYTAADYFKEKPNFVNTCYKAYSNFKNCTREQVQRLLDVIGAGLPELGMPPIDPLFITEMRLVFGEGAVRVSAELDDFVVAGFSDAEVLVSKVDKETYNGYTKLLIPKIRVEGTYDLQGRILLVPMVGQGVFWFEPTNTTVEIKTTVKLYDRHQFTFFDLTALNLKYSFGDLKLHFNNLFDGIKQVEDLGNAYMNENWRLISESLRHLLTGTIEDSVHNLVKNVFEAIPANFIIGDIKKT